MEFCRSDLAPGEETGRGSGGRNDRYDPLCPVPNPYTGAQRPTPLSFSLFLYTGDELSGEESPRHRFGKGVGSMFTQEYYSPVNPLRRGRQEKSPRFHPPPVQRLSTGPPNPSFRPTPESGTPPTTGLEGTVPTPPSPP